MRLLSVCLIATLLIGAAPAHTQAQDEAPIFEFEALECPDWPYTMRCGRLTVPEDRTDTNSPPVALGVIVFLSHAKNPAPDPIIYLNGGPGGSSLQFAPYWIEQYFEGFLAERDVIFFDQRGTGLAYPSLDCPETIETHLATLDEDISDAELVERFIQAMQNCRDRLTDEGINLGMYASTHNAADLDALRQALGYASWNLYGISYGTRLALTLMRDYPDAIRSVILDSTYPPQTDLYAELTTNIDRAYTTLFEGCAAHPACSQSFPDLETTFYEAVEQLNQTPARVTARYWPTGERYQVRVNGGLFMEIIFESLYRTDAIPRLPALIYDAHQGRYEPLVEPLEFYLSQPYYLSEGMYYAVQCVEETPFSPTVDTTAIPAPLQSYFDIANAGTYALCETWGQPVAAAIENEPVHSDIPTLILAGEYDPVTPPRWGALAAETLTHSTMLTVPGYGHGVTRGGPCPLQIAVDFVNDPQAAPDLSCLETLGLPDFVTP